MMPVSASALDSHVFSSHTQPFLDPVDTLYECMGRMIEDIVCPNTVLRVYALYILQLLTMASSCS